MQPAALVDAMAQLSRAATRPFRVEDMLRTLCAAAAEALEVDATGVMVRHGADSRFVHASAEVVSPLEELQELLQAGPCVDGLHASRTQVVDDIGRDGRWPAYQELARRLSVGSMVSVPLLSRDQGWGALDLYRHRPGPWPPELVRAAQVLADVAVSYVVMAHDRDQVRLAHEELAHRALHDDLTGLPNRALLVDRLEHALSLAGRTGGSVAVVFLDVDAFKAINDTYGHTAGDAVLVEVAERLQHAVRSGDTVARLSGDEFVIVCEGLPDEPEQALRSRVEALVARLQTGLSRPMSTVSRNLVVSASVGVALNHLPARAQSVIAEADAAMYTAKQAGRGQVRVRDLGRTTVAESTSQLQRHLGRAAERGELRLHYQPIVCSGTRDVVAVEALLRWARPSGELLDAATFVDTAVRAGHMTGIGRWVVRETCRQMAEWSSTPGARSPATAYVNLSGRELSDESLPAYVAEQLLEHGLEASQIGLEIVEDHLADAASVAALEGYRQAGHRLSVDDFGTGYSSLARLVDLPIHLAKLDKSLVDGLPEDERRSRLIHGVLLMGTALGFEVVAEGVEHEAQDAHLTAMGCQMLQGYHPGPPVPGHELTSRWATARPGADSPAR